MESVGVSFGKWKTKGCSWLDSVGVMGGDMVAVLKCPVNVCEVTFMQAKCVGLCRGCARIGQH